MSKRIVKSRGNMPKSDGETRSKIKEAARKLFAERGVEAVTVREIVAEAGAKNGGSLNYYFKSKEGLIDELVADVFAAQNEAWADGLQKLEMKQGPKTVHDLVEAMVAPSTALTHMEPTHARFISSMMFTRRHVISDLMIRHNLTVFSKLLRHIANLHPEIPERVMQQRFIYLVWYITAAKAAYEAHVAQSRYSAVWDDIDAMANLVDTAAGLVSAPVSAAVSGACAETGMRA